MAEKLMKLQRVECDPMCGFMVQSHDEREILEIVKQHARKSHDKTLSDKDVRALIKST